MKDCLIEYTYEQNDYLYYVCVIEIDEEPVLCMERKYGFVTEPVGYMIFDVAGDYEIDLGGRVFYLRVDNDYEWDIYDITPDGWAPDNEWQEYIEDIKVTSISELPSRRIN